MAQILEKIRKIGGIEMKGSSLIITIKIVSVFLMLIVIFGCTTKKVHKNTGIKLPAKAIDGFFSVKWGDDMETAKNRIYEKFPGAEFLDLDYVLIFIESTSLLNKEIASLRYSFNSNGMYMVSVLWENNSKNEAKLFYNELKDLLVSKYGEPDEYEYDLDWSSIDSCYITLSTSDKTIYLDYHSGPQLRISIKERESNKLIEEQTEKERIKEEKEQLKNDI